MDWRLASSMLILGLIVGCNSDGIVDNWPTLTIAGQVRSAGGEPMPDFAIRAELVARDCASGTLLHVANATTGSDGRYTMSPDSPDLFEGCVRVRATPPSGGGEPTTVEREDVSARPGWPSPDPITIDIVLP